MRRCSSCSKIKPLSDFSGKATCDTCRPKKRKYSDDRRNAADDQNALNQKLMVENCRLKDIIALQATVQSQAWSLQHIGSVTAISKARNMLTAMHLLQEIADYRGEISFLKSGRAAIQQKDAEDWVLELEGMDQKDRANALASMPAAMKQTLLETVSDQARRPPNYEQRSITVIDRPSAKSEHYTERELLAESAQHMIAAAALASNMTPHSLLHYTQQGCSHSSGSTMPTGIASQSRSIFGAPQVELAARWNFARKCSSCGCRNCEFPVIDGVQRATCSKCLARKRTKREQVRNNIKGVSYD